MVQPPPPPTRSDGDGKTIHATGQRDLRQKWFLERTHREIARSVGVGVSTVSDLAKRARSAGLDCWDVVEPLGEDDLEQRLYGVALRR